MERLDVLGYECVLGLDVGKRAHHAWLMGMDGQRLWDKPVGQDERELRALYDRAMEHGRTLLVVDQTNTIGSLPLAVAGAMGMDTAYLPGLSMRRYAQMTSGHAKTDRIDSRLIAECALANPSTLTRVDMIDPNLETLELLSGYDDDLAADTTRLVNRLRAILHTLHPALERALGGEAITSMTACKLLEEYGGPHGLREAGRDQILQWVQANLRAGLTLPARILDALDTQTTVVSQDGPQTDWIIKDLARRIRENKQQRARIERRMHQLASQNEEYRLVRTIPGMGTRTSIALVTTTQGMNNFPNAGRLASYAGLCPARRQSGTSIHHDTGNRHGNHKLKRALYLSASIAIIKDPRSRAYYQRKRNEGKHHTQALLSLARRRCDLIHAILKHHTPYQTQHTPHLTTR
ncbi:IS110 family transposase [Bifidobacterium biavatii]|uniref:Transposase IS116/IS110/IS902 family protein n=1 Tax=Bifidobacterium biavatii DSM 23969 TaxID=1437608 RepID=A0A086ZF80_9BIFI|nr:IS110 family transposase [Bifidobacterium biavatii]KFI45180.1 transposase IS116/IS110/IS902 family protein [Bifidobacterium biavatii DSM 23969]